MLRNQLTNTVVMVSPLHFGFNPQTAASNPFQHNVRDSQNHVQQKALQDFKNMVYALKHAGVSVVVLPSNKDVVTPDSLFPNNWFSHHQNGKLIIYPMLAPNRSAERQVNQLVRLLCSAGVAVSEVVDMTSDEKHGNYLEGTGSLVLERGKNVAFGMESPRTTRAAFDQWCRMMGYEGVFFKAYDNKRCPIYHTNVVMNIGRAFAVVCLASITNKEERNLVEKKLRDLNKTIISITMQQMYSFCGNVLQLLSHDGKSKIVMSATAWDGFTPHQKIQLGKFGDILAVSIPTIERVGGGSARCMLAEIFKP